MFHLLPDSLDHIPGPGAREKAVGWMVLMILLQHIFHFHQHDFSREASDLYDDHDHGHGAEFVRRCHRPRGAYRDRRDRVGYQHEVGIAV